MCVTHAHKPKLQDKGNNVSRLFTVRVKKWKESLLSVMLKCNSDHMKFYLLFYDKHSGKTTFISPNSKCNAMLHQSLDLL